LAQSQSKDYAWLETADAELLAKPLCSLADIEAIERTPLAERLRIVDFTRRMDIALASRDSADIAIHYIPDGNIDTPAVTVSFGELRRNIARTAALLRDHGIARGNPVAILMPAIPALYWALLGAMATGIAFPINWMMEPSHILHLLLQSKAKAVIALGPTPGFKIWQSLASIAPTLSTNMPIWSVPAPGRAALEGSDLGTALADRCEDRDPHLEPISGDDIAAYVHSGGTTGMPKIVKLAHRNLSFRHWTLQLALKLIPGEVIIHDTPMFHVGGLAGRCFPPLACGASIVIPSIMGARDRRYITNYWKFVERYRITRLSGVPTTLAVLAKTPPQDEDLSSLAPFFMTGSTAMPISVREDFERVSGVRVLNSYGMTENTASIAVDPRDGAPNDGSSGIRLPYTNIRAAVMDETGRNVRLCGPNEIGMLQVSGAGLTPGYVDPSQDLDARTGDGWLITGDLGRIDANGYIFVTGRAKDVIIRGGHNIDPAWIEEPLLQCPDVLLCAAVGKPDAYAGELPVAYVQLVPGSHATAADLIAFLAGRVAERAAMPKEIFIVEKLPLTDVGKPIKARLRQDAAEHAFANAISEATGLRISTGALNVSVNPHPSKGTLVSITLTSPNPDAHAALMARIEQTMGQYSVAHEVVWRDPVDHQNPKADA
jgi:fatty-acyl-CoA synthase